MSLCHISVNLQFKRRQLDSQVCFCIQLEAMQYVVQPLETPLYACERGKWCLCINIWIIWPQRPQESQGFPDHTLRTAALRAFIIHGDPESWFPQEPCLFSLLQERSMHMYVHAYMQQFVNSFGGSLTPWNLWIPQVKNMWPGRKVRIIPATFALWRAPTPLPSEGAW